MQIVKKINNVREYVKLWKKGGLSIGFVPTMGYLHEGHQSLIKKAVNENDRVIVSIFVNPMQFEPTEDLDNYPRDLDNDAAICRETGADLIFFPEPSEMYLDDFCSFVDMTGLTDELCGKSRPTHFRGVCTVVSKLFNIVHADKAYFGQKDAQQLAVIKRLVRDLNIDVEIVGCPIIRESDGLAKSSRNTYLNKQERKAALILNDSLTIGQKLFLEGERDAQSVLNAIINNINAEPLAKIDYVDLVDAFSLKKIYKIEQPVLVAVAVYIGKTRLIDNIILDI